MAPSVSELETATYQTPTGKLDELKRTETQDNTRVIPKVRGSTPSHTHIIDSSFRAYLIHSFTLTSTLPKNGLPLRSLVGPLVNLHNGWINLFLNFI